MRQEIKPKKEDFMETLMLFDVNDINEELSNK